jgi:cob(I)alamin adenosyltransferase
MSGLDRGFVHVYTGDGKGKTTAALGLSVRAALAGLHVFIGQFMKGSDYAELRLPELDFDALAGGGVELVQYGSPRLICQGEEPDEDDRRRARAGLEDLTTRLAAGGHDLVVADEILVTLHFGLLDERHVLDLIDRRPPRVELVLTGRGAPEAVIERADLVTRMQEVRHYFARGVTARRGIEH